MLLRKSHLIFQMTVGLGWPTVRHLRTASSLTAWMTLFEKLAMVAGTGIWGDSATIVDSLPSPNTVLAVTQKL